MMSTLVPLLLATGAAAQITTSFWMAKWPLVADGPGGITFAASVINAEGPQTTLHMEYHPDTDFEALTELASGWNWTATIASTMFEYSTYRNFADARNEYSTFNLESAYGQTLRCDKKTTDIEVTCTNTYGPAAASRYLCNTEAQPGATYSNLWTYPADGTTPASVETIVVTYTSRPASPLPEWCQGEEDAIPSSARVTEAVLETGTYELVITAGEEKLSATTGAVASSTGAPATSTSRVDDTTPGATGPTESSTAPVEATGVASPMKTVAPALAGLGAAVAVFML